MTSSSPPNPDAVLILNPGPSPCFAHSGQHVRCAGGQITEIGDHLRPMAREHCIDAGGGALLPGLHDHHIHLLATAAARASLDCAEGDPSHLPQRIRNRAKGSNSGHPDPTWVRAINYHESIAGELDRHKLDEWLPDQPLRIQHSTGSMWVLNSTALELLDLDALDLKLNDHNRLERDSNNRLTGRLFRADELLRERLQHTGNMQAPDLTTLSRELARFGVTSVTDTSATNSQAEFDLLHAKQQRGELLQRVRLMGNALLPPKKLPLIHTGELKLLLDEAALPDIDQLIEQVRSAHQHNRGVAFHCVTRIELAVVISVLSATGAHPEQRDRVEHASLVPANTIEQLRELGVQVVTQPGLIHSRGDRYLKELASDELEQLYRLRSLLDNNVPVAGSSDAPYGPLNPWLTMQCAVERRTLGAAQIGAGEAITAEQAISLYCDYSAITPGQPADLCVLSKPWSDATARLTDTVVSHTLRGGELIHTPT